MERCPSPCGHGTHSYAEKLDLTTEQLRTLVDEHKGLREIKEKWHESEPRVVKVYELNAANIIRNLPNAGSRNGKEFPDLIIKTFRTANGGTDMPARREVGALRWLNKLGCEHAPTLLRTFKIKKKHFRIHVVVMKKIEGVTLSDCYRMTNAERLKVRSAFAVAVRWFLFCLCYP